MLLVELPVKYDMVLNSLFCNKEVGKQLRMIVKYKIYKLCNSEN